MVLSYSNNNKSSRLSFILQSLKYIILKSCLSKCDDDEKK